MSMDRFPLVRAIELLICVRWRRPLERDTVGALLRPTVVFSIRSQLRVKSLFGRSTIIWSTMVECPLNDTVPPTRPVSHRMMRALKRQEIDSQVFRIVQSSRRAPFLTDVRIVLMLR